jgi:hypothetical protein
MNDKYINFFTDFGFKKLFGSEPNKDLLMDFLNELLKGREKPIKTLTFKRTEQETGTVFCDKLNFIYIEMPKFNKTEEELETHFDKWLFAIKNLYRLDAIPGKLKEQVFERFFEIAEIASMNPEERFSYESSLKYYRDMKNVIDTAKGEGWEEGRQEGRQEGMQQGMQQGMEKGMQQEAMMTLMKILEKRFGQVPAAVIKQMQAADTSQLEIWIDASLDAASLQEIFRD